MPLKFVLGDVMKRHKITQKALSDASGVRMNTIKDLRLGEAKALTVANIDPLINAVNQLSGEKYGLDALMIYVHSVEDGE